jgi:hypothetical protein
MNISLFVAHQTQGRTRLRLTQRLAGQQRDEQLATLIGLAERLGQTLPDDSGLLRVEPRPATGSLIIEHPDCDIDELERTLGALDCRLESPPAQTVRPGLSPLLSGLDQADRTLRESTSDATDLRTLMFLLLVGLAVAQLLRGQVMAPATSLLWYAFDLALPRSGAGSSGD